MMEIYSELDRLLTAGERCVLARIIRQDGSAPRSVGTRFLIKGDGRNLGTIGGGLLEHEVLDRARDVLSSGRSAVLVLERLGRF